ncbi:Mu transposase domain-containing protein [Gordonia desulfuricans]|uniref:Mu transposase domain-containing protein n=1 Tax=Gordonia desulfuricans TaxID=89051 RepID=UPI0002BEA2D5
MELFTQIEQSTLKPLPPRRCEHAVYHVGKVAADCHVTAGIALYSVPWRLIGQRVTVRIAGDVVQVFDGDEVAATHVLHMTGRSTNFETTHPTRSPTPCRRCPGAVGKPTRSAPAR